MKFTFSMIVFISISLGITVPDFVHAQTPSQGLDPKTEAYYKDLIESAPQFAGNWIATDLETEKLGQDFCKATLSTKDNPVPMDVLRKKYEDFADLTLPLFKSKELSNELKPLFISYLSRQTQAIYCPQQLGELNKLLVYNGLI